MCKRKVRELFERENGFLCTICRSKNDTIIGLDTNSISYKNAIGRIYEMKKYISKEGYVSVQVAFPKVLSGIKFKIVVVQR